MRAKLSSGEMAVPGDQWPLLVYTRQEYDPEEPWNGLFRNQLLSVVLYKVGILRLVAKPETHFTMALMPGVVIKKL